jgi:hypothetical protein
MKRPAAVRFWMLALALAGALIGSACTSLPPAKPATDVKAISGYWVGYATGRFGSGNADFRIGEDGRYEASVSGWPPSKGKVWVAEGKYRIFSETRNIGGTLTLHEGDRERVLALATDDGIRGEYRLAK